MAGEVASISSGYLCKVWEIKSLGWDQDAEANHLLQSMAKQVEPIMRKRRWRVTLLSEFCPRNPSLLGLNVGGGQEIKIRLRPHNRRTEFLPYESLLGTMLHELTHNVHSQHNANFYKLLDEITLECEDLIAKGVTGSQKDFGGFGKRLGGHSHNPSLLSLRSTIATAAEKRLQAGMLMPPGPHCLGGDRHIMKALTPVQAAAMAAERRQQDDIWCGSAATASEDKCTRASAESSTSSVAAKGKLTNSIPVEAQLWNNVTLGQYDEKQTNDGATRKTNIDNAQEVGIWECTVCTLLNRRLPQCVVLAEHKIWTVERNPGFGDVNFVLWKMRHPQIDVLPAMNGDSQEGPEPFFDSLVSYPDIGFLYMWPGDQIDLSRFFYVQQIRPCRTIPYLLALPFNLSTSTLQQQESRQEHVKSISRATRAAALVQSKMRVFRPPNSEDTDVIHELLPGVALGDIATIDANDTFLLLRLHPRSVLGVAIVSLILPVAHIVCVAPLVPAPHPHSISIAAIAIRLDYIRLPNRTVLACGLLKL